MFGVLQILTVMVVAIAFALSLAHALELPGKMRLDKEDYFTVQPIYYPGFTIGGVSEPVGTILLIILLFSMPFGDLEFWLTFLALLGLIGMVAIYWIFIHPINKFWLEGENLDEFSAGFFSFGTDKKKSRAPEWTELRDAWEYSHVARAAFSFVSLLAIIIAII